MPLTTAVAQSLGSIAGMGSTFLNSIYAKRNTDLTIKANKELADYQYQKNLESWKLQNEYNTPAAQMQRFKDAGLNPNLIYGQGNAGNAQQISSYQAPKVDYQYKSPIDPMQMTSAYLGFRKEMANVQTAEAVARHAEKFQSERAKVEDWKSDKMWADSHIQTMVKEMMGGTYESNNPKGEPTPWQSYQMEALKLANEQREKDIALKVEQKTQMSEKTRLIQNQSDLMKKEVDNFLLKMWTQLGLNTANTLLKLK